MGRAVDRPQIETPLPPLSSRLPRPPPRPAVGDADARWRVRRGKNKLLKRMIASPECTFFAGSIIGRYSSFSGIAVAIGGKIAAGKTLIYDSPAPLSSPNPESWQSPVDCARLTIDRIKQLKLLQTNNLATITARTEANQNMQMLHICSGYGFPYATMTAQFVLSLERPECQLASASPRSPHTPKLTCSVGCASSFNFLKVCFTGLEYL